MHVRRNAALFVAVLVSMLGGCTGRPFLVGAEPVPAVAAAQTVAAHNPCPFGRRLTRRQCRTVARYVEQVALARFFAALWAWDNPPSPGFSSWACVATAESGADYRAHGSQYSSAFGMLNEAVRERADSPASASRILAGVASPGEERRAAWREDLAFGPSAWGLLTQAKCRV